MRVERRRPTPQEWRSITSPRGGRRGVQVTRVILRALKARDKRGEGERVRLTDREALRGDAAERQVDKFIEHRSRQFGAEAANERARQWQQAERDEAEDRAALRRELWVRHHRRLAGVHAALAEQNRVKAERLASSSAELGNGAGP